MCRLVVSTVPKRRVLHFISREEMAKLNEKERRLTMARYADAIGPGGIVEVSERYHASRNTVRRGLKELRSGDTDTDTRVRKPGAGRRSMLDEYPGLLEDILSIADATAFTVPDSDKKQLGTSCRKIAAELEPKYQHHFGTMTVQKILLQHGYECPRSKPKGPRATIEDQYPGVTDEILRIAEASAYTVPDSDKKQLGTSCRKIVKELEPKYQHKFNASTIFRLLRANGYECPRSKDK